jgi:anti-anti-sigma factor
MHENDLHGLPTRVTASTTDDSCALTVDRERGFTVFRIAGIIDVRAQQLLEDIVQKVEDSGVWFDFAGVKRINSMGIALLLRCFKKIRDNKRAEIRLLNLNQVNSMLFRITGIFLLARPEDESRNEYVQ